MEKTLGSSSKTAIFWLDILRFFAITGVVAIHVNAPILYLYGKTAPNFWAIGNVADSFVRFSVPLFVMLSGALIFSKEYALKDYFKRRFSKILLPFLFWSLVYIGLKLIPFLASGSHSVGAISRFVFYLIRDGIEIHLWFMFMIIGLYLIFPVFSKWIRNSSLNEISLYLAIWVVMLVLSLPIVSGYFPKDLDLRYFTGYLGYAVLGYYLYKKDFGNPTRTIGIALFTVGFFLMLFGTIWLTERSGKFDASLYDGLSPVSLLMASGIFLAFKNSDVKSAVLRKMISEVSAHAFGIYLSHILILKGLYAIGLSWQTIHPAVGIPLTIVACLIGSYVLTRLIRLLPLGQKISG